MTGYHRECEGCRTSQDLSDAPGGIVKLSGGWIVNQYRASQGYLGWLVLQPRFHRDEIAELTDEEVSSLGQHMQALDSFLRSYWVVTFPDDPIERVYFVYFFESPFDVPKPPPFHLHIHVIPRTKCIGAELRERDGDNTIINAWKVYCLQREGKIPEGYRRPVKDGWPAAHSLLNYLRNELERPG